MAKKKQDSDNFLDDMNDDASDDVYTSGDHTEIIEALEKERDDAIQARQRALADYANFQKRSIENEAGARRFGMTEVLRSLLPVLDHFDLALNQDLDAISVQQLADGVGIVRAELLQAMEQHGVTRILPDAGDEFDPTRHEAMLRQESEGIQPNHIVAMLQPGFALKDIVLRPAKVAVAPDEN